MSSNRQSNHSRFFKIVREHGDSLEIYIWARHCDAFSARGLPRSCKVRVSLSPQCLPLIRWYALPACSSTGVHLLRLLNWYIFTRCPSTGVHLLHLLGCQILSCSPLARIPIFNSFILSRCSSTCIHFFPLLGIRPSLRALSRFRLC